jgi:hypothetical protein
MSESKELIVFNKQLNKFLEALQKILPNDLSIKTARSQISSAIFVSPKKVLEQFIKHVFPFKNKIMEKDESYFLETEEKTFGIKEDNLSEALQLKNIWKTLRKENKEMIWTYFQVLIVLAEKTITFCG